MCMNNLLRKGSTISNESLCINGSLGTVLMSAIPGVGGVVAIAIAAKSASAFILSTVVRLAMPIYAEVIIRIIIREQSRS